MGLCSLRRFRHRHWKGRSKPSSETGEDMYPMCAFNFYMTSVDTNSYGIGDTHIYKIYTTTIDILPDDVLLEIFDCVRSSRKNFDDTWERKWNTLVHVCRRWRQLIFASPLRLDLTLLCTYQTPVKKLLSCWPAFPIVVDCFGRDPSPGEEDNVFAALENSGRVREVFLSLRGSFWRKMAAMIQQPFPALNRLSISLTDADIPVVPGGFVGGSFPSLRDVHFYRIPIPNLPTFLSSASNIVKLELDQIPPPGYISPAALVACLGMLPTLEELSLSFQLGAFLYERSQSRLPFGTRAVLAALTTFLFAGENAYLEDLMARIDAPRLSLIDITHTSQLQDGDLDLDDQPEFLVPEFSKFISRSGLNSFPFALAEICFDYDERLSVLFCPENKPNKYAIAIRISSTEDMGWQVLSMAQVLHQTSAILSKVLKLNIKTDGDDPDFRLDNPGEISWVEVLLPFTAVELLRVSRVLAETIALALERIDVVRAVLPALNVLCLMGQPESTIKKINENFQLCGRPLFISGDKIREIGYLESDEEEGPDEEEESDKEDSDGF